MRWHLILGRIALRTGVALWRQRVGLIIAGVLVTAFGAYQLTFAGWSVTNGDCADTAMAALTRVTDASARAAYACLGPGMKSTTEDQFVVTMRQRAVQAGQANRVADRHTPDGGKIVFYTVTEANMPAVGYVVYLDHHGLVTRVE